MNEDVTNEAERIIREAESQVKAETMFKDATVLMDGLSELPKEEQQARVARVMQAALLKAEAEAVTEYRRAMQLCVSLMGYKVALEGKMEASDALAKVFDLLNETVFEDKLLQKAEEHINGGV